MKNILRLLIISILFLFFGENTYAQTSLSRTDLKYIEFLISQSIDSFRLNNKLDAFVPDSAAYRMAYDHCHYLSTSPSLTHEQSSKTKRTVSSRMKYFKTNYTSAFELLARVIVPDSISSLNSTSEIHDFVWNEIKKQWLETPSNRALLLISGLNFTALSLQASSLKEELTICLILAKAPSSYLAQPCISCFPYANTQKTEELKLAQDPKKKIDKNLPWNLKAPGSKKSMLIYRRYRQQVPKMEMARQSDSLFIKMGTIRLAKRFFKNRRDGLSIEVVPFSIYNINKEAYYNLPGRRNNKAVFDGAVNKPAYKKKIFRSLYTSKNLSKDDFVVNLSAGHPFPPDELVEINLIFIKKNRVVGIVPFVSRCGEPLDFSLITLPLKNISDELAPTKFKPSVKTDTLKLFIPFDWNEYYIDTLYLNLIQYKISRTNYQVDSARINSFASVEGNIDINSNLYRRRAEPIVQLLKQNNFPEHKIVRITTENWDLFKKQLTANNDSFLLYMRTDALQKWVNEHFDSAYINNLLKTQRYTYVWIKSSEKVTDANIDSFAIEEFNRLMALSIKNTSSGKWQAIPAKTYNRLEAIQKFLLQQAKAGKINISEVRKILDPELIPALKSPLFRRNVMNLMYNQASYESASLDSAGVQEYLKFLELYMTFENSKPEAIYNFHALTINQHSSPSPFYLAMLKKHISVLEKKKFQPDLVTQLQLYYHYQLVALIGNSGSFFNKNQAGPSLRFLYNYYVNKQLNDTFRIKLASNFWYFEWDKQAMATLEPMIKNTQPNSEALKLWLLIKYGNLHLNLNAGDIQDLMQAANVLTPAEWCNLFTSFCRINFQLLDSEPLYLLYCELKGKN